MPDRAEAVADWVLAYRSACAAKAAQVQPPGDIQQWALNEEYQRLGDDGVGGDSADALQRFGESFGSLALAAAEAASKAGERALTRDDTLVYRCDVPGVATAIVREAGVVYSAARSRGALFGVTAPLCCSVRTNSGHAWVVAALAPVGPVSEESAADAAAVGALCDALLLRGAAGAATIAHGSDGRRYWMPSGLLVPEGATPLLLRQAELQQPQQCADQILQAGLRSVADALQAMGGGVPTCDLCSSLPDLMHGKGLSLQRLGELYALRMDDRPRQAVLIEMLARVLRRSAVAVLAASEQMSPQTLIAQAATDSWRGAAMDVAGRYALSRAPTDACATAGADPALASRLRGLCESPPKTSVSAALAHAALPYPPATECFRRAATLEDEDAVPCVLEHGALAALMQGDRAGWREGLRQSTQMRLAACGKKFLRDAAAPSAAAAAAAEHGGCTVPRPRPTRCCRDRVVKAWRACAAVAVDAAAAGNEAPRLLHTAVLLCQHTRRSGKAGVGRAAAVAPPAGDAQSQPDALSEDAAAPTAPDDDADAAPLARLLCLLGRSLLQRAAETGSAADAASGATPAQAALKLLHRASAEGLVLSHSIRLRCLDLLAKASAAAERAPQALQAARKASRLRATLSALSGCQSSAASDTEQLLEALEAVADAEQRCTEAAPQVPSPRATNADEWVAAAVRRYIVLVRRAAARVAADGAAESQARKSVVAAAREISAAHSRRLCSEWSARWHAAASPHPPSAADADSPPMRPRDRPHRRLPRVCPRQSRKKTKAEKMPAADVNIPPPSVDDVAGTARVLPPIHAPPRSGDPEIESTEEDPVPQDGLVQNKEAMFRLVAGDLRGCAAALARARRIAMTPPDTADSAADGRRERLRLRAMTWSNAACMHRHAGRLPQALRACEAALSSEAELGQHDPATLVNFSALLVAIGRHEDAVRPAEHAASLVESRLSGRSAAHHTQRLYCSALHNAAVARAGTAASLGTTEAGSDAVCAARHALLRAHRVGSELLGPHDPLAVSSADALLQALSTKGLRRRQRGASPAPMLLSGCVPAAREQ